MFYSHGSLALTRPPQSLDRTLASARKNDTAKLALARAYAAFHNGDADAMRRSLHAIPPTAAPRYFAWQLCLLSWAASLERRYAQQAQYVQQMVCFIEKTPEAMEVELLAHAAQTLAELSREAPSIDLFEFTLRLAERIAWEPDLAQQKFRTERALAWVQAARGDHRTAQRMMHVCGDTAPSPQWRATVYGELAYMMRMAGAGEAAAALLDHAITYARSIPWESAGEERVGLLSLIDLSADHDPDASLALLHLYDGIAKPISEGLDFACIDRLKAMEQQARGCAIAMSGRVQEGAALLRQAFSMFDSLRYAWRSAATALRLHAFTGDRKWIRHAQAAIAAFPACTLADEIRRQESGSADPRFAALSSSQRRTFELVCRGMSDAQIARALSVSVNTTRNHVAAIRRRFDVHSRSEVIAIARSSGLLM